MTKPDSISHQSDETYHTIALAMINACSIVINHYRNTTVRIKQTDIAISIGKGFDTHFQCFENQKTKQEKYVITFGINAIIDKLNPHQSKITWTTTEEISSGRYMEGNLSPLNIIVHTVMHECAHLIRYASQPNSINDNGHDNEFHKTLAMMYYHNMDKVISRELTATQQLADFFGII
ncbi:hypothetical protein [Photobacterium damselae]|uniref:hypothetical protein n=1 Tax=Photobacterium damselae TaxID=38293 RepID=UPI001F1D83D8|nr:hypothetical protein [Photobacterium damselae]UKA05059.1 hypothetical protein IHC89_22695 [Photobacterium damselae subsp. damselae]